MDLIQTFFDQEKKSLSSFIFRMTKNIEDTEDILQETMLSALKNKDQFTGDSNFKTWVFSIASNKAIDFLRKEKRWDENVMDRAKQASMSNPDFFDSLVSINNTSPHGTFEVKEHIDLCYSCISKTLDVEKQVALILKDIYEFTVKEIAQIVDKTESQVKHYLEDARAKMIEVYDRRCALINKNGVCNQCSELNGIFNPKQDFEKKKQEIKFAKDVASKSKEELYQLRNELVKSIDPLNSEGHEFQKKHLELICQVAKN